MRNLIYKGGLLISISVLLFCFSLIVNAAEYGSNSYNQGPYSTYTPATGSTGGTTQAFRDKFIAEQQALVTAQGDTVTTPSTTPTSPTTLNITRTLRQGMNGDDVKELQTYLNTYGYNCGTVDGDFGPKTKAAVIFFQQTNNLTSDGIVGPLTMEKMNQSPISPTSPITLDITRTLRQGMNGDDVKELQTYLNTHGYDCGITDGDFGPKTNSAVVLFQEANGLDPDGIVGPLTREKMK